MCKLKASKFYYNLIDCNEVPKGNMAVSERLNRRKRYLIWAGVLALFCGLGLRWATKVIPTTAIEEIQSKPPSLPSTRPQESSIPPISQTSQRNTKPPFQNAPKPPFQNGLRSQHYPQPPHLRYQPSGGPLPNNPADFLSLGRDPPPPPVCKGNRTAELWQYRAPYALILGAMKAGTRSLVESLWEHDRVMPTKHSELGYFSRQDPDPTIQAYGDAFSRALLNVSAFQANPSLLAIDKSPRYLIHSDRVPHNILCMTPWVKLLVILRDPVSRAASHFRFLDESRLTITDQPMVDWKKWVYHDLRLLTEAGVLNASSPAEEHRAWAIYQGRPHSQQIVGQGLYVIPLEMYKETMEQAGKPWTDLYVMHSEAFRRDRQKEYDKVLKFLDLEPHTLQQLEDSHVTLRHNRSVPMPEDIQQLLTELYRPFNKRLYELLGWEPVWDM